MFFIRHEQHEGHEFSCVPDFMIFGVGFSFQVYSSDDYG
jgi:hypothetical protein